MPKQKPHTRSNHFRLLALIVCMLPACLSWLAAAEPSTPPAPGARPRVLVISLDGMGPEYLFEADRHQLKIPTLRKLLSEGAHAAGVVGVVPSFTYPSHTTMITGVWPAEHGVHNNKAFDPQGPNRGKKHTDAGMVKVETLWRAARAAGYTTANVGWPVTTGAPGIDWLMPANAAFEGKDEDAGGDPGKPSIKANPGIHYDNPPGLRALLAPDIPNEASMAVVERRVAWSLTILRRYKPEFMTVHIGGLDHAEHDTGPFSRESKEALEEVDDQVRQLVELERSIDPNAYIVIVSDHGQVPVERVVHLGVLFAQQGLVRQGAWDAALWNAGGSTAVMLRDPSDTAIRTRVEALLRDAAKDPAHGIAHILTQDELARRGGFPDAAFLVELNPGFQMGSSLTGEIVRKTSGTRGQHGYLPDRPGMHASLIVCGPGVAAGRDLGVIDMRQIAPTIAQILRVPLPTAKQPPLDYGR